MKRARKKEKGVWKYIQCINLIILFYHIVGMTKLLFIYGGNAIKGHRDCLTKLRLTKSVLLE
jgi:hypothetical protein